MDIVAFVDFLANVAVFVFAGISVAAVALFFFDRSPVRKASVEASTDNRERRAA